MPPIRSAGRIPCATPTRPWETLRPPAWDRWIADGVGLTDDSDRLPRTALARPLQTAAALGLAVSAVARRVAGFGRVTVR